MAERSSRVCAVILIQIKQRQMEAQSARSGIKAWLPRRSAVALKLQAQTIPARWVILHVVVNAMVAGATVISGLRRRNTLYLYEMSRFRL
jgi:hypothetical protein